MEKKKSVSLQVDGELLKDFDDFCKAIGSTRSGILSLFMKYCVIHRELPFKPGERRSKEDFEYDYSPEPPLYVTERFINSRKK